MSTSVPERGGLITEEACPKCQARVPIQPGFTTWCEHCGWNVEPLRPKKQKFQSIVESVYGKLGASAGAALFQNLMREPHVRPRLTLVRLLAYAMAGLVQLVTVVLVGLAVWALFWLHFSASGVVLALLLLGIAWVVRPRVPAKPKGMLPREKVPTLYQVVEEIAREVGLPGIDGIVLDSDYNAAFMQYGLRRQTVFYLGVPLWQALDEEERVALVAHEMAHGANGDPVRGFWLWNGMNTLQAWCGLFLAVRDDGDLGGYKYLAYLLSRIVGGILAGLAMGYGYLLLLLTWRDSQRAEFLADELATHVSGREVYIRLLEKLHLAPLCQQTLWRVRESDGMLHYPAEWTRVLATVPAREWERIRREAGLEKSKLDATHPPTRHRLAFVASRGAVTPTYRIAPEQAALIERELEPICERIDRALKKKRGKKAR